MEPSGQQEESVDRAEMRQQATAELKFGNIVRINIYLFFFFQVLTAAFV